MFFDGTAAIALTETAKQILMFYGLTKLAGEKACVQENPDSIIIRTSWVYSSFGANFVKHDVEVDAERTSERC
jgi:dTDP-4-dehydrorhamnose reductase